MYDVYVSHFMILCKVSVFWHTVNLKIAKRFLTAHVISIFMKNYLKGKVNPLSSYQGWGSLVLTYDYLFMQ